jgi:hypothetical protein
LIAVIAQQRQAQREQIANIVPQALSALHQNMEQRQRDRIANTLLAAQQTGQPVTPEALKTASDVGRFGFGGAPVQDYGGAQTYNAYNQALDMAAKRQSAQFHNVLMGAQAVHYLNPPKPEEPRFDVTSPTGQTFPGLTAAQAASLYSQSWGHSNRSGAALTKEQQAEADKQLRAETGYGYDTWKNVAYNTPYSEQNPRTGRYLDVSDPKNPKQISTEEAANNPNAVVEIPTGTTKAQGKTTVQTAQIPTSQFAKGTEIMGNFMGDAAQTAGMSGFKVTPHVAAQGGGGGDGNIPRLTSPEQARELPSGQLFYDDKGTLRRVP